MSKKTLNAEIVQRFRKYCSRCKGICCSKEINAFSFEIEKWPKVKLEVKKNWQRGKSSKKSPICRFNIGKHCPFLLDESCRMPPAIRPIDCITYPVYPMVGYKNKRYEMKGLVVHKSCPFAKEVVKDPEITRALYDFWGRNLKQIDCREIKIWLGDKRNYWLEKNIIKIKDV
jgi:hypothetical protein